jgi:hypothetical protein
MAGEAHQSEVMVQAELSWKQVGVRVEVRFRRVERPRAVARRLAAIEALEVRKRSGGKMEPAVKSVVAARWV